MQLARRVLPRGPAGRIRRGKRQDTTSDPFVILGLPESNTGTDGTTTTGSTGLRGTAGSAGTGVASGADPANRDSDPDSPVIVSVTVIEAGSSALTTIGIATTLGSDTTISAPAPSTPSSVPLFNISSSTLTSTPALTASAQTKSGRISASASTHSATQQSQHDASTDSAVTPSNGVSPAAIAGILIFVGIAVIAALIYFIRKRLMSKRQQKRATRTWATNMFIKSSDGDVDPEAGPQAQQRYDSSAFTGSYLSEKPSTPPAVVTNFGFTTIPATLRPGQGRVLSPVSTRLSPTNRSASTLPTAVPSTSAGGPAYLSPSVVIPPATFATSGGGENRSAVVRCTYIPRLPDELSVTMGQKITVSSTYDDGWALCTNEFGEHGVVPLDCLNADEDSAGQSGAGLGTNRASSLRRV